jgi:hypothetical protein
MSNSKLSLKSITELPIEIVEKIAIHLDNRSFVNWSSTCRTMRNYMTDPSFGVNNLFITVNEKKPWLDDVKRATFRYHYIVECKNPHKCVETLLRVTHVNLVSISLRLSNRFNIKRLGHLSHVRAIEWTINNPLINHKKYLDHICLPPNLKTLTINNAGIHYTDEHCIDIDSIKEIVNARGIHVIIKLPFPSTEFTQMTDGIDHVTIVMEKIDSSWSHYYTSDREITFTNNKTLTVDGILIDGSIEMNFKNVGRVKFINFRGTSIHRNGFRTTIDNPRRLMFDDFEGLFDDSRN